MLPYFALLILTTLLVAASSGLRARGIGLAVDPGLGALRTATDPSTRKKWTWYDLLALSMLVAFAGSRVGVGTDYDLYVYFWGETSPDDRAATLRSTDQDVGFAWLQLILKGATADPQTLFWVTAALTVIPVFWVLKDRSRAPALAVWLYVALGSYLLPLNVIRQGLAATILLVAAVYFLDRRRWVYVLLALVASSIHASAIPVAVILYLARNWRPRPRTAALVISAGAVLAGVIVDMQIFRDIATAINPRYSSYVVTDRTGIGTYLTITAKGVLVAICYGHANRLDLFDRRYLLYATIGIATLVVGTQSLVLTRLDIYFSIFLVLALPNALKGSRNSVLQLAVVLGTATYMAVFLANYAGLLGYESTLFGG